MRSAELRKIPRATVIGPPSLMVGPIHPKQRAPRNAPNTSLTMGLAIDSAGNLFVAGQNGIIEKFNSSGVGTVLARLPLWITPVSAWPSIARAPASRPPALTPLRNSIRRAQARPLPIRDWPCRTGWSLSLLPSRSHRPGRFCCALSVRCSLGSLDSTADRSGWLAAGSADELKQFYALIVYQGHGKPRFQPSGMG